jgi:hypothetical protein
VSNSTDGIEAKIVCDGDNVAHRQNFAGSFLSPLNSNTIWVEDLSEGGVESSVRYALLVPLERTIGVMVIRFDGEAGEWLSSFTSLEGIDEPCKILFIQKLKAREETLYSICIYPDSNLYSTKLYEIEFDTSAPQESTVRSQYVMHFDGVDFSNVVFVKTGRLSDDQRFFVVRDGTISSITPINYRQQSHLHLNFDACLNLTCSSLFNVYVEHDQVLLAHCQCCSDETCAPYGIYYDIHNEYITNQPADEGLPYHCPDFETVVIIYVSAHQFSVQGETYELKGSGFTDGLCSGNSTALWFAYVDGNRHIFVVAISSATPVSIHKLSESACLNGPHCSPIANVSDILVIQEFNESSQQVVSKGIDPHANDSVLFEVYSSQPNLFALVSAPVGSPPSHVAVSYYATSTLGLLPSLTGTSSPTVTSSPTQTPTVNTRSSTMFPIAVIVIISLVAIGVGVGGCFCCMWKCPRHRPHQNMDLDLNPAPTITTTENGTVPSTSTNVTTTTITSPSSTSDFPTLVVYPTLTPVCSPSDHHIMPHNSLSPSSTAHAQETCTPRESEDHGHAKSMVAAKGEGDFSTADVVCTSTERTYPSTDDGRNKLEEKTRAVSRP